MASKTFWEAGIVIKKTKLGESDLIISFLSTDGSKFQAIAKGARKPQGSLASRLELFSEVDVLLAEGKSLNIVKECRLKNSHVKLRMAYEQSTCASALCEVFNKITHENLAVVKLYDLFVGCISHLENSNTKSSYLLLVSCFLKACAFVGFKPSFTTCVSCGEHVDLNSNPNASIDFAFSEGGILCRECAKEYDSYFYSAAQISWMYALLMSKFDDVSEMNCDESNLVSFIQFCDTWARLHLNAQIKALAVLVKDIS
jgi:DNA repair protein RecO (recombination protein O)